MLRQRCLTLTDPPDDVLATDPARPRRRHPRRAVSRRARRAARHRRRRLREAPADDRAALRDGLHHRQPRQPVSREAKRLGLRAGAALLALWTIALGVLLSVSARLPAVRDAHRSSARRCVENAAPFDFVDLYIPSNPFNSLANNIVPAVVLFSVVLGVALIGVERKQVLLDVLEVAERDDRRARRGSSSG